MDSISLLLKEVIITLEDRTLKSGEGVGLKTGLTKLDELLFSLKNGHLITIGARPLMGKTSLALNIAYNACVQVKRPVIYFSNEMSNEELTIKLLSNSAKVSYKKTLSKKLTEAELDNIIRTEKMISTLPFFLDDINSFEVDQLIKTCRKKKSEDDLSLVIVDNFQTIKTRTISTQLHSIRILSKLKALARELDCPVIILSNLSRKIEERPNQRPYLSDFLDSGIEQITDVAIFVYRDEIRDKYSKEPGIAEIMVVKNRLGDTGMAKVAWNSDHGCFENL